MRRETLVAVVACPSAVVALFLGGSTIDCLGKDEQCVVVACFIVVVGAVSVLVAGFSPQVTHYKGPQKFAMGFSLSTSHLHLETDDLLNVRTTSHAPWENGILP